MAWTDLWHLQIPVIEKVLRTVLVYGGMVVLLRLGGKRDLAQVNSFDLVVMLLLANVVQNAVIGNDNSVTGGLLGAAVLVLINAGMVRFANRHEWALLLFEGRTTTLVKDGRAVSAALRRLGLRRGDVIAACRRQGADDLHEVKEATMSPGGSIVVHLQEDHRDVTVGDLRVAHARLLEQIRSDVAAEIAAATGDLERRLARVRRLDGHGERQPPP